MHLIVGLGNPGPQYALNRHNAGFMLIARIADRINVPLRLRDGLALVGKGYLAGKQVVFAKPQTFMNSSGKAVQALLRHYPVELSRLMIIFDDVALPLGMIRIRRSGSSGGHNGMASIIDTLATQEIIRMRIGVGTDKEIVNLSDFVLTDFRRKEIPILNEALDRAIAAIEMFISEGVEPTMSYFNSRATGVEEEFRRRKN